ncbi:MAG TPA: thioredoxin [Planctomycetaceae bacterium]|nr:thioredoxin [Planctomycetaceae bacterium]
MASTKEFTTQNFGEEVLNSDRPVLVDFWAPWCGPCRLVGPAIENVSDLFGDKAKVGKLNIDDNPETASDFGITAIPSVLVFKDGQVVDQIVGIQSQASYVAALQKAAA